MAKPSENRQDTLDQAGTIIPQPPSADETVLARGIELGNFRLEAKLGRGGMGEVWKAYDIKGKRFVVLKFVSPELRYAGEEMARVQETFQRIHAFQHQHVCPVHGLDEDKRFGWYLVMKYINGQTLSTFRTTYFSRHGSFPVEQVVKVLRPVATALDYAHLQKVIHRDIKPQNIMIVGEVDDVQVVDFGIAAEIRTTVNRISQVRMDTSGARPYMAPEQWRGEYQDAATDQYALAVVAYELLCGRLPFDSPDFEILANCVQNNPPLALKDQFPGVNAVLLRGLAKRREERFDSCREFIETLDKADSEALRDQANVDSHEALRAILSGQGSEAHLSEVFSEHLPNWRRAAEAGVPSAQWLVGRCCFLALGAAQGRPGAENYQEAVAWYRKAAEQEYAPAQNALGFCRDRGLGVPQGIAEAVGWYRKAAEHGFPSAQCSLAFCYASGRGVKKDRRKAMAWYRKAAEQEHARAENVLGRYYQYGRGVTKDPGEAFRWYRKAAEQGYTPAQRKLADCYRSGTLVDEDPQMAFAWYEKAATQGNSIAQRRLGNCFLYGDGVEEDRSRAVAWYHKSAEQGNSIARTDLADCLFDAGDLTEAIQWYQAAAEQGNRDAWNHLGDCFLHGWGVRQDETEAVQWYRKAAERDHADAQASLADCLFDGVGVEQDREEAAGWYQAAAENGNTIAGVELGDCFYHGWGVEQDKDEAIAWFREAAQKGNETARERLLTLKSHESLP
ncbi:MAG: SEL1-like repeat protein [Planctomycetes bacterium]|nr:SEL1-like repeat protein [Planctomycetota bacterium]